MNKQLPDNIMECEDDHNGHELSKVIVFSNSQMLTLSELNF